MTTSINNFTPKYHSTNNLPCFLERPKISILRQTKSTGKLTPRKELRFHDHVENTLSGIRDKTTQSFSPETKSSNNIEINNNRGENVKINESVKTLINEINVNPDGILNLQSPEKNLDTKEFLEKQSTSIVEEPSMTFFSFPEKIDTFHDNLKDSFDYKSLIPSCIKTSDKFKNKQNPNSYKSPSNLPISLKSSSIVDINVQSRILTRRHNIEQNSKCFLPELIWMHRISIDKEEIVINKDASDFIQHDSLKELNAKKNGNITPPSRPSSSASVGVQTNSNIYFDADKLLKGNFDAIIKKDQKNVDILKPSTPSKKAKKKKTVFAPLELEVSLYNVGEKFDNGSKTFLILSPTERPFTTRNKLRQVRFSGKEIIAAENHNLLLRTMSAPSKPNQKDHNRLPCLEHFNIQWGIDNTHHILAKRNASAKKKARVSYDGYDQINRIKSAPNRFTEQSLDIPIVSGSTWISKNRPTSSKSRCSFWSSVSNSVAASTNNSTAPSRQVSARTRSARKKIQKVMVEKKVVEEEKKIVEKINSIQNLLEKTLIHEEERVVATITTPEENSAQILQLYQIVYMGIQIICKKVINIQRYIRKYQTIKRFRQKRDCIRFIQRFYRALKIRRTFKKILRQKSVQKSTVGLKKIYMELHKTITIQNNGEYRLNHHSPYLNNAIRSRISRYAYTVWGTNEIENIETENWRDFLISSEDIVKTTQMTLECSVEWKLDLLKSEFEKLVSVSLNNVRDGDLKEVKSRLLEEMIAFKSSEMMKLGPLVAAIKLCKSI